MLTKHDFGGLRTAKSELARTTATPLVAVLVSVVTVRPAPRVSMRSIKPTSMTSASSARRQAWSIPSFAVAAHQPQEPVDLAHLSPRQRILQHRRGVGADVLTFTSSTWGRVLTFIRC